MLSTNQQSEVISLTPETEIITLTNQPALQEPASQQTETTNQLLPQIELNSEIINNEEENENDLLIKNFFTYNNLVKTNSISEKIIEDVELNENLNITDKTSSFEILKKISGNISRSFIDIINRNLFFKKNNLTDSKYKKRMKNLEDIVFYNYWGQIIFLENKYSKMNHNLRKNLIKSKVQIGINLLKYLLFLFYFIF
jgi:hypothetical protein